MIFSRYQYIQAMNNNWLLNQTQHTVNVGLLIDSILNQSTSKYIWIFGEDSEMFNGIKLLVNLDVKPQGYTKVKFKPIARNERHRISAATQDIIFIDDSLAFIQKKLSYGTVYWLSQKEASLTMNSYSTR